MNMVYSTQINSCRACLGKQHEWRLTVISIPPYPSLFINLLTTTMPAPAPRMHDIQVCSILKRGRTDFGEYQLHHDVKRVKNPVTGE